MSNTILRIVGLAGAMLVCAGLTSVPLSAETRIDASRITSIGSDATEILYALGLGANIVAVDTTSNYPPEALEQKRSVGYMRALSTEGVLSTGATVIVANAASGPPEVIRALKQSSIPVVTLPANEGPDAIAGKVRALGEALGVRERAATLAREIETDFAKVTAVHKRIPRAVRALFILNVSGGRAMVAGNGTTADAMLEIAGAINAAGDLKGYKPLGDESVLALAPDVIVTVKRHGTASVASLIRTLPAFAATPAGKSNRVVEMDMVELLGFGPRAPAAARSLLLALYPDVIPD